ncbi:MAG: kelch repeat-containing protein [Pseudomonadota bacterium]
MSETWGQKQPSRQAPQAHKGDGAARCSGSGEVPNRRALLKSVAGLGVAAGLNPLIGLAGAHGALQDAEPRNPFADGRPGSNPDGRYPDGLRAPSRKPGAGGEPIVGRWARLADMPIPVQEIYPAPFWTETIARRQGTRALRAQRFNIIVSAGGITGVDRGQFRASDQSFIFDPATNTWTTGPRLPGPRHHLHLVPHNGFLFALGGFSTLERRRQRRGVPSAQTGWTMRNEVWRLDDINDRWRPMAPMPIPQAEAACVSLGGFIHIAGGRSPTGSLNGAWSDHIDTDKHYVYDARGDRWFEAAPMPTPRNSMAAVGLRGAIYTFGGRTVNGGNLAVTQAYDPLADRWQTMRPMPKPQGGTAAAAIGNTIFVFGGEYFSGRTGNGGVYREIWAFDTSEDRWRSAGLMPRPRHGHGAVSIGDTIYTLGGASQPGGYGTSAVTDVFSVY